jgi:phenylacetate-CoA ligase
MMPLSRLSSTASLLLDAQVQRRVPFFSKHRLEAIQSRRFRSIIRHAYESVPFYRQVMDQRGLRPEDFRSVSDLRKLPLVDKDTVQDNLDRFQSWAVDPASCLVLKSARGGAMTWTARTARRGLAIAERERAVWLPLSGRRLGCKQLHILSPASSTLEIRAFWDRLVVTPAWVSRKFFADPFRSYEEIIATLNEVRPDIAFSFGSYVEHFFRFLADSGISPALPRAWYYGADALSPHWRNLIKEKFGVEVYSNYAATETGRIGFECERRSGYHLNIDFTAVRLVDEQGEDVPAGEVGEVIVSNLHNTATVLLNYRLGDLAEMSTQDCPCGRNLPLLRELHGRALESIQLADGRRITSGAFWMRFRDILCDVRKVQIVARGQGRMCWRIVPGRGTERQTFEKQLLEHSARVFGAQLEATVEFVDDIPTAPSGKFEAVKHDAGHNPAAGS